MQLQFRVSKSTDKKVLKMFIIISSTIALAASFLIYTKFEYYWNTLAAKLWLKIKFHFLGATAVIMDIVHTKQNRTELPQKRGNIAIVTGGSRGIGLATVKMLLQCDMEVIIACRDETTGKKAIDQIRESGVLAGHAKVYTLDNSFLKSVKQFADKIKEDYKKIDILINNAGIMFGPYTTTEDDFEMQWTVNYLSHFLLTSLLMPLLCHAGTPDHSARIINVSSCAHSLGTMNFRNNNSIDEIPFNTNAAYAQSKLAQVIFTRALQKICDEKSLPVKVYAVNPGITNTNLFQYSFVNKMAWINKLLIKTPEQGAVTTIYAAVSDEIENKGGLYLSNCREAAVHPMANDIATQEHLFKLSLEQTRLEDFI